MDLDEYVKKLYQEGEYILKNPSLGEEDCTWKVTKIVPLLDRFFSEVKKGEINLLDVGGGVGIILHEISTIIGDNYSVRRVNNFAIDMSPGILELSKKNNPDLKMALNEDIRKTSLANKEIDLTLLIDVLEHIPNPVEALEQVRRISRFAILKVPLEDNFLNKIWNLVSGGKQKKDAMQKVGHINIYNFRKLRYQIEKHMGQILYFYFTDVFDYFHKSEHYRQKINANGKFVNLVASQVFKISPRLCSIIFSDFVMMLVKCY